VTIQVGAVLAVLILFARRLHELLRNWQSPETRAFFGKLGLAFLVTAIGGLILEKFNFQLPETLLPVALATFFGGIAILWIEEVRNRKKSSMEISWRLAALIGLAQIAAAGLPGLSRSGVTILLAVFLGVERTAATEFSFLLGVPTLCAAAALKLFSAWQEQVPVDWGTLGIGTLAAFLTALLTIRIFMQFLRTHTFRIFGWYRLVLGVGLFLLLWKG